ncbi:MAG: tail fiber assembly protein [Aeromonas veronii]
MFSRSVFGEYGEIAEYNGPIKEQTQRVMFAARRAKALEAVERRIAPLERARRLGLAEAEELEELEGLEVYSVQLMRAKGPSLPKSPIVR